MRRRFAPAFDSLECRITLSAAAGDDTIDAGLLIPTTVADPPSPGMLGVPDTSYLPPRGQWDNVPAYIPPTYVGVPPGLPLPAAGVSQPDFPKANPDLILPDPTPARPPSILVGDGKPSILC